MISGENPAGDTLKLQGISRDIRDEIVKRIARNGVDEYLIPRNDALGWNKTPAPIRQSFHSYTFCGTGCYGKQVARTPLRSSRTGCRDGKGSETRDGDTMRTQFSVRKRRCRSAARRKRPCRRNADGSPKARDGVPERVPCRDSDRERNARSLRRDVSAGGRFNEEVAERPGGHRERSRSRRGKHTRGCPDDGSPDLMSRKEGALPVHGRNEITCEDSARNTLERPEISRNIGNEIIECIAGD